jgi:predicted N-formylglutamate amidohydrolase
LSAKPTLVISCEHGGNTIPARYAPLFVGARQELESHRGHDIGALDLARYLARHLQAPLYFSTVSRLLVDLNRSPHHRQLCSSRTRALDPVSRQALVTRYYAPYRSAVEKHIARLIARGRPVLHISVHSFTPVLRNTRRDADIGLLYDPARRRERVFCKHLQEALAELEPALRIRRNYPYKGTADGFTTWLRTAFSGSGYAGLELEINQRFFAGTRSGWHRVRRNLLQALSATLG